MLTRDRAGDQNLKIFFRFAFGEILQPDRAGKDKFRWPYKDLCCRLFF